MSLTRDDLLKGWLALAIATAVIIYIVIAAEPFE